MAFRALIYLIPSYFPALLLISSISPFMYVTVKPNTQAPHTPPYFYVFSFGRSFSPCSTSEIHLFSLHSHAHSSSPMLPGSWRQSRVCLIPCSLQGQAYVLNTTDVGGKERSSVRMRLIHGAPCLSITVWNQMGLNNSSLSITTVPSFLIFF